MQIDLNALAVFTETLDCDPDFEDDAFTVEFQGERVYIERHRNHFLLQVQTSRYELPR